VAEGHVGELFEGAQSPRPISFPRPDRIQSEFVPLYLPVRTICSNNPSAWAGPKRGPNWLGLGLEIAVWFARKDRRKGDEFTVNA
jgi:hypothetical protein